MALRHRNKRRMIENRHEMLETAMGMECDGSRIVRIEYLEALGIPVSRKDNAKRVEKRLEAAMAETGEWLANQAMLRQEANRRKGARQKLAKKLAKKGKKAANGTVDYEKRMNRIIVNFQKQKDMKGGDK
jgi:hypothetical protein